MGSTQGQRYTPKQGVLVMAILVRLLLNSCATASGSFVSVYRFRARPDDVIYVDIGGNLTLRWRYGETNQKLLLTHKDEQSDRKFLFGEWSHPGYVSNKILLVRGSAVMMRQSDERKVHYDGNLSNECSNCSAEITLFNLTHADFKTYGVTISIYPYVHPLQSTLRIVRRVPATIKYWVKYVRVHVGNTTNITCHAKGMPRPLVEIQKDSKTVAKGTGDTAVFNIDEVKPHHEGKYHCVVFPKDKTAQSVIREEMKFEVIYSWKKLQATTEPTTLTINTESSSAKWTKALYSAVLICLVIMLAITS